MKVAFYKGKPIFLPPMKFFTNIFYPVGSYYETTDTTFNPNTTWGGTWVLEDEGLVHVSSGTNYVVSANSQDGGEATHTLTAAESGVPSHGHSMTQASYKIPSSGGVTNGITGGSHAHDCNIRLSASNGNYYAAPTASSQSGTAATRSGVVATNTSHTHNLPSHTHTVSINTDAAVIDSTDADASSAHNNMQPYKIVNRWHRTA